MPKDNDYYRNYRDKNRESIRAYNTKYQRERRARIKAEEQEKARAKASQELHKGLEKVGEDFEKLESEK